jgi:hypothetical protein
MSIYIIRKRASFELLVYLINICGVFGFAWYERERFTMSYAKCWAL